MRRAAFLFAALIASSCATDPAPESRARAASNPGLTQDERMVWWREARFGMFIHWGLYAIPAGEWGGKTNYGEWIRESAQIPLEQYERFQPQFNPVKFDADEWARMAADAGMKYLVITSKHHDGFCLFDSKLTDWDVMATPFQRDILKELSEACARHGVRFCTYHSIMDWHHPDYLPRRSWESRPVAGADFARFREYLHGQVAEVVRNYSPDVMWFDGEWESTWTHEYGVELFRHCRELDPTMLVNNRVDVHRGGMAGFSQSEEAVGDFGTPEQEIPASGAPGVDWETCMTMNDHWGFNSHDANWKSSRECIRMLADIASKGGNYLLNVGPRADGTFPPEAVERLASIGKWMKVHGESITGTTASPFDALAWGRCTLRRSGAGATLYLHVFERPASGEIVLPGIGSEPAGAKWMESGAPAVEMRRVESDIVFTLPQTLPDADCSVIAVALSEPPVVYREPEIRAAAEQFVEKLAVELACPSERLELRYTLDGSEPSASSAAYSAPLSLAATTTVRVRAFHSGRPVTRTVERAFRRVEPRQAIAAEGARPGLRMEQFAGTWEKLPDFSSLATSVSQVVTEIGPAARTEFVGRRFSGLVEVERAELYEFALACDDGAKLWIDGELVVDNDGLHGLRERVGSIALAAGKHALRVEWFNRAGGSELSLRSRPVGGRFEPLAAGALSHLP